MSTQPEKPKIDFNLARDTAAKFLSVQLALFTAIMTVASVFISAASVLVAVQPQASKFCVYLILVCSLISMLLMVLNFIAARGVYLMMLDAIQKGLAQAAPMETDGLEAKEKASRANKERIRNSRREVAALGLLLPCVVAFGWIVAEIK